MESRIANRSSFNEAMHLCWQVAALVKYGHFQDAVQEVRSADFLAPELKEVICQHLKLSKEFRASLLLDPFIKRCLA
jgi:hypothetical protein